MRPGHYPSSVAAPLGSDVGRDAVTAEWLQEAEIFNSPAHYVRSTLGKLPNSVSGKKKTHVPLGVVIQPLAQAPQGVDYDVSSIATGTIGTVIRCKSCRAYINPYVKWAANGQRWTCNLCGFSQLTPDAYFASLDEKGKRTDRFQRPELCRGAVEYIAPGEYLVRPPQAPVFVYAIEVSYAAVVTGMLDTVVSTIKEAILSGNMPGGSRTQVCIMTYDNSVHFYNLSAKLSQPQMVVLSDLEDLFLPLPEGILVNLADSEASVLNLLDVLPQIFADNMARESCLGSAIKAAFLAMKHIGGKLLVFGSSIPSLGALTLKASRDNPRLLGTEKEAELLRPVNNFYKDLASDLVRAQVTVELFFGAHTYIDLASIAPLAKWSGGDLRYYPQFHIQTHGMKLKTELMHVLTRYMGWEAVMRVRVSRGWKITKFHGHFFLRGADLLVVPNCHTDQTFGVTIDMEENVTPDPILCLQSSLLYTNSDGERRIRVHTWAAATTHNYADIMGSVDVEATAFFLAQDAMEQAIKTNFPEGRNRLQSQCQQVVQAFIALPNAEALQFLPLYVLGMLKSQAFRATQDISLDLRTWIWLRLESLPVTQLAAYFRPRLMALHDMSAEIGLVGEAGRTIMPPLLNLTSESMKQDGVYLVEDGETMLMWIGRNVDSGFLQAVFGTPSFEATDSFAAQATLGTLEDLFSVRLAAVINQVRAERPTPYMQLQVVRQGEPLESRFFASLTEDRTIGLQSTYSEFLQCMGYRAPQPPLR